MVEKGSMWSMKCSGGYDDEKSGRKMVQRRVYVFVWCVWCVSCVCVTWCVVVIEKMLLILIYIFIQSSFNGCFC